MAIPEQFESQVSISQDFLSKGFLDRRLTIG